MVGLIVLLAAGAAVNSLGAALSVPDWPLSYGRLLPLNFVGNAVHEQSHRIMAVVCALLMAWLGAAIVRHEDRRWVRALGLAGVALYFVQVLLGGGVVVWLSPGWLTSVHTVFAQLTFVLVFLVVLATSRAWREGDAAGPFPASRLVTSIAYLTLLQIVLGAASRHPPAGEGPYIVTLLLHLAIGVALPSIGVVLARSLARQGAPAKLRATATVLSVLLVAQLGVGLALFIVAPEPLADQYGAPRSFSYLHIGHVLIAALVLAHAAALALRFERRAA